jgi:hypothetical protein
LNSQDVIFASPAAGTPSRERVDDGQKNAELPREQHLPRFLGGHR